MSRFGWHLARLAVAAGLIYLLTSSGIIHWEAVARLFEAWPLTLLAFSLLLVDFAVTSYRVCVLVRPHGFAMSLGDSLRLALVGNLFAMVLPVAGGDFARMFYAARDVKGRRFEVATLLLVDRILGLLGLLLLPLLAIPFNLALIARSRPLQLILAVAAAGSLAILAGFAVALSTRARQSRPVVWVTKQFPMGGYSQRLLDTLQLYRGRAGALGWSLALGLVAHVLSVFIIWLLMAIMSGRATPAAVTFLAAIGFTANSIPLTPGGLGVGEAAFNSLFALAGVRGGAEALLGWRLLLLCLVPPGLALYLGGRRQLITVREHP